MRAISHPGAKGNVSRFSRSSQEQLVDEPHSVLGAGDGVADSAGVGKDLIVVTALVGLFITTFRLVEKSGGIIGLGREVTRLITEKVNRIKAFTLNMPKRIGLVPT